VFGTMACGDVQWRQKCTNHLHQCSVCDPATKKSWTRFISRCDPSTLEILDEVRQSNPVNPLKHYLGVPGQNAQLFQSRRGALEESNKYSKIVFIECSLFLIIYIV